MQTLPSTEVFEGTRRYMPTRVLGAGSWGTVYQAYDNERNAFVAVKLLSRVGPEALMRFKREFRALQNVVHPNLVTLYELLSLGDQWFFTMELVDGVTFLEYVHGTVGALPPQREAPVVDIDVTANDRARRNSDAQTTVDLVFQPASSSPTLMPPSRVQREARLDDAAIARLRNALGQLVDGLCALHASGKLHRDVKPSNVLVTSTDRVVILDFGLVRESRELDIHQSSGGGVVGTPAYMSPEQSAGADVREATDWYSVGVLLFEALTGEVPYEAKATEMMISRRELPPIAPSALVKGVPKDLDELCVQLLAREPRERLTGQEVRERLVRPSMPPMVRVVMDPQAKVYGRDEAVSTLQQAADHVRTQHQPALVKLIGAAGVGKSLVARKFLFDLRDANQRWVVLEGRCGETETVPFKAFDGVIDELVAWLAGLPANTVASLLPRDFSALCRLFPVLHRLEMQVSTRRATPEPLDALELRRRAFRALREMLARIAERYPLAIFLDDLQWGDEESAALLEAVLRPPDAPAMLFIASSRPLREGASGVLVNALEKTLNQVKQFMPAQAMVARIDLPPLSDSAAEAYARSLLGETEVDLKALVREAQGSPWLIEALVALIKTRGLGAVVPTTLGDWVKARIEGLSEPARRLLEVVAVAGRPVERLVAWHAAALDAEVSDPLVGLKALRMLSTTQMSLNDEWLEVYDEHLGKAVQTQLSTARHCELLLKLAAALEASPGADAETLADWYEQAGQVERASKAAETAAVRAMGVLAFERAAKLFNRALVGKSGAEFARLLKAGADALALAGRSKEAAGKYLSLVEQASPEEKIDCQRRAAELLLHSGHFEEGIEVLKSVLDELGELNPQSRRNARWFAIYNRMRVQWRGLKFTLRPATEIPQHQLLRVDAYWAAAKGYGLIDPMRGNAFQFVHCRHALDCGEPYRVGRALALEAGFHALQGLSHREEALNVLGQLRVLIDAYPNDHLEGLHTLMTGCEALGQGRIQDARPHFERAEALFREKCPGMTWESSTALQYLVQSEFFLGDFSEVRTRTRETEASAESHGDVYALTNIRVRAAPWVSLMADDSKGARARIEDALNSFVREGYFVQHFWGWFAQVSSHFYDGNFAEAKRVFHAQLEEVTDSGLLRIQLARIVTRYLHGAVALAVRNAKDAEHAWRQLEREKVGMASGFAGLLKGGVMAQQGQAREAAVQLARSEELLQSAGFAIWAKAAMRGRGLTVAGVEGAALVTTADQFFTQRGVKRPDAFARMLLPAQ